MNTVCSSYGDKERLSDIKLASLRDVTPYMEVRFLSVPLKISSSSKVRSGLDLTAVIITFFA